MNVYANDFNTTVQTYYKELKNCNPISKEEERKLIKEAKENNIYAKNKILSSNLKFVFNVAKRYKGCGAPLEDLIAEGNIGLTKALDKFDLDKDVKFISYAVWWVRQSIQEFIKKKQASDSYEVSECEEFNYNVYDCGVLDHDEDEIVNKNETILSNEEEEENKELEKNRKLVLNRLLKKLNPRGQFIIKSYYGIGIKQSMTLEEIGNVLKISKERVRQIKEKQLRILRSELMMIDNMSLIFK